MATPVTQQHVQTVRDKKRQLNEWVTRFYALLDKADRLEKFLNEHVENGTGDWDVLLPIVNAKWDALLGPIKADAASEVYRWNQV